MFPIYPLGSNSGFTYDTLSEIRPSRIRTGLATLVTVGCLAVVALAWGGESVQAEVPNEATIHASLDAGHLPVDVVTGEP